MNTRLCKWVCFSIVYQLPSSSEKIWNNYTALFVELVCMSSLDYQSQAALATEWQKNWEYFWSITSKNYTTDFFSSFIKFIHCLAFRMFNWNNQTDITATNPWYNDATLQTIFKLQIAWGQICFVLGMFGNVFVLYATIGHSAIRLDKMSVWIIKNLAATDICNCVLVLLPTLLTQYGKLCKTLIFGETFYEVMGCYLYTFFVANLFLVNVLSLNKLMRCLYPLHNLDPTKRQRITVTIFTVLVSVIPSLWVVYGIADGFLHISGWWAVIDYLGAIQISNSYRNDNIGDLRLKINYTIIGIFNALPCISLVIINSGLLIVAVKRANSAINKKNLMTVILVTVVFFVSIMPHFLSLMFDIPKLYDELAWSLAFLSTWVNPIIYVAVNPRFREFTKRKIIFWGKSSPVQQSGSATDTRLPTNNTSAISMHWKEHTKKW